LNNLSDQAVSSVPLAWLAGNLQYARIWIILSVLTGFSGGLLLILQALLLSRIIHGAFMDGLSRTTFNPLLWLLLVVIIVRAALAWAREVCGFQAGARIRKEIRMILMRHIGALGPVQGSSSHSGGLSTVLLEQVEALQAFYALYLPQLALAVAIPAAILVFIFPISWAAGGLFLLTAPIIPLFMVLIGMGAESISQRNFQALSRLSAHFLDILQGLPTLKLLNRSQEEDATIAHVSDDYRQNTMKVLRIAFLSTAVLELASSLAIALVAVYLGTTYLGYSNFGLYGQTLTLKHGLFILLLAPDFYFPLRELGTHYHARAEALGAAQSILEILTTRPETTFTGQQQIDATVPAHINLHQVGFSYSKDKGPVLKNVDMRIAAGEHVAFVGQSGSGKTTILNLILGFIQPRQGQIRVNGMPLPNLDLAVWQQSLAWLGQDPLLFQGSITTNIRLGKPDASPAEIKKAAQKAHVLDFAQRLSQGLDTQIGEQGWGLSRGQAQRVALARMFLKDAPIILLDEPTAGLDGDTAQKVMEALMSFSNNRTLIMLTHRWEQLDNIDTIYGLENGSVFDSTKP
jgi:ATP-binding cassette subfamily C protein CydD